MVVAAATALARWGFGAMTVATMAKLEALSLVALVELLLALLPH